MVMEVEMEMNKEMDAQPAENVSKVNGLLKHGVERTLLVTL